MPTTPTKHRFPGVQLQQCIQMHSSFNDSIWAPISAIAGGIALGSVIISVTHAVITNHVEQIHRLTAIQCSTHAWEGADPKVMIKWCEANGYSTN